MLPTEQSNVQESAPTQGDVGFSVSPPAISVPKGGGAIRGIGEEFSTNPVTGTSSMIVPIFVDSTSIRTFFFPIDYGAGNQPYGFGWNLSLPAIIRKTDKGCKDFWVLNRSEVVSSRSTMSFTTRYSQRYPERRV